MKRALLLLLTFISLLHQSAIGQTGNYSDYLILVSDTIPYEKYGYVNLEGDTVIGMDKYPMCFTDTFSTFAIVLKEGAGFVGIDRQEKVLFKIFTYDNGPDYPSEGLMRIIRDDKIGYADLEGNIVIEPQFDCAFPFKEGVAKVSIHCKTIQEGEHSSWMSDSWFYIDKRGNRK